MKETYDTRGGLASGRKQSKKPIVTTNGKKSAEVICTAVVANTVGRTEL